MSHGLINAYPVHSVFIPPFLIAPIVIYLLQVTTHPMTIVIVIVLILL